MAHRAPAAMLFVALLLGGAGVGAAVNPFHPGRSPLWLTGVAVGPNGPLQLLQDGFEPGNTCAWSQTVPDSPELCPRAEASNPACADGSDNDADGFTDCADAECGNLAACTKELSNAKCADGIDNEGDGFTDCQDADCATEGIVVCAGGNPVVVDPAQYQALANQECTNGLNDDGNGLVDCNDLGCLGNPDATLCKSVPVETTNASCANGLDDDRDALTDCADPSCQREGVVVCDGPVPIPVDPSMYAALSDAKCSDGSDNDGNSFTDCSDLSCSIHPDATVCPESNDDECADGQDNDLDGLTDCDDLTCGRNPYITVCAHELSYLACSDGVDNDDNGSADCADFSCSLTSGRPACLP